MEPGLGEQNIVDRNMLAHVDQGKGNDEDWVKLENHEFNPDKYYRIVSQRGYNDFLDTGIIRSSPTGTEDDHRPTAYPTFAKGNPDLTYSKKNEDNYIFETDQMMYCLGEINPITNSIIRGRHWGYRLLDEKTGDPILEIKPELITKIYKVDKDGCFYVKKLLSTNGDK